MHKALFLLALGLTVAFTACNGAGPGNIDLGPRPYYLVADMDAGPLKNRLAACTRRPPRWRASDFSIGHRGAPLQFPEHTEQSYRAAARMGAGIIECDVAVTKDRELVCRHSQCDLHTTTNILETNLAALCREPFTPFDGTEPANAKCCTSDLTLAQFKTLRGKMDGANPYATTVTEYLNGTPTWRTELYAREGTLLSHRESIALFQSLGVKMAPELKAPPDDGPSRQHYAQQLVDEYRAAGVPPNHVYLQSFSLKDVKYWLRTAPEFAPQVIFLDDRYKNGLVPGEPATWSPTMAELAAQGVRIIAPPLWMLVTSDGAGGMTPSPYALAARRAGLDIIAWSLERSGPLAEGGGWYYQSVESAIDNDGDVFTLLHVLADDIGVIGVFSDWPATTTFYANCLAK